MSKCSIQDIAKELGLSRNTVSKALNGKKGVSLETKKIILAKASEMKYKDFLANYENSTPTIDGSFLFLTKASPHSEFWLEVMKGIEDSIKDSAYNLQLGVVSDEDLESNSLPKILFDSNIKGLIIVEICNLNFISHLLSLNLPIVSVDYPSEINGLLSKIDIITMENKNSIISIMKNLKHKGLNNFAFAGNLSGNNVSSGFMERYDAFKTGINTLGVNHIKNGDITLETNDKNMLDIIHLVHLFQNLETIPDCYICGNDWTAIQVGNALKLAGINIPEQVSIVGFDNISDSLKFNPPLTTINVPKKEMGRMAGYCMLAKMNDINSPKAIIKFQTDIIDRESTK